MTTRITRRTMQVGGGGEGAQGVVPGGTNHGPRKEWKKGCCRTSPATATPSLHPFTSQFPASRANAAKQMLMHRDPLCSAHPLQQEMMSALAIVAAAAAAHAAVTVAVAS